MRRISLLATLVALLVGLVPIPASAQSTDLACPPPAVPDAGFTDVDPASVHKLDIDCLVWWEITTGTSPTTFDPKGAVTRWQMALFLMRTFDHHASDAVDGFSQGFTDIAGLSPETQTAINQLKQLSITSGTTPTTFTPNGTLARWEMALFLTRLLRAMAVALPSGADQGFTDIGGLPPETQTAINQLKQLGITAGTTPTTFSPNGVVTREQMASFLPRTLQATRHVTLLGVFVDAPCADVNNCTVNGVFPANTAFVFEWYVYYSPLPVAPEDQDFFTSSTRVEVTLDGTPLVLTEKLVSLNDVVFRSFEVSFPGGLTPGSHTFVPKWYFDNLLEGTWTWNYVFTES